MSYTPNYLYPPPASRAAIRRAASTAAARSASPAGGRAAGGGGGGGAAYVGAAYVGGGANAVVAGGGAKSGLRATGAALCGREKAAGAAVLTEAPIGFIFANLYRSASGGDRVEPRRLFTSCLEKASSSRDPRQSSV